jgi:hypothetical protein
MCVVLGTQQQVRRVLGILLPRKSIQYPHLYRHKKQPETAPEYDHASVSAGTGVRVTCVINV